MITQDLARARSAWSRSAAFAETFAQTEAG
jgi:hypothetical protein